MSSSFWNRAVASLLHWWGRMVYGRPADPNVGNSASTKLPQSKSSKGTKPPPNFDFESPCTDHLSSADHISVGSVGEAIALTHLRQLGLRLIEKNFRILGGEIDLVMLDQDSIVFVEVKALVTSTDDDPSEAVDDRKQRILTRGALAYLKQRRWLERAARFDVVAVRFSQHPKLFVEAATSKIDMRRLMKTAVRVEHYRNAFEATGDSFYG